MWSLPNLEEGVGRTSYFLRPCVLFNAPGFTHLERKIGCDKGLPLCNNCARTGRECLGYGVRLVWPDIHDGRRKLPTHPAQNEPLRHAPTGGLHYGQQFLNVSYVDIVQSRQDVSSIALYSNPNARPRPSLTLQPQLRSQDGELLQYCKFEAGFLYL